MYRFPLYIGWLMLLGSGFMLSLTLDQLNIAAISQSSDDALDENDAKSMFNGSTTLDKLNIFDNGSLNECVAGLCPGGDYYDIPDRYN